MAARIEIILGVINNGVTVGAGATAVSDQFVVNNNGVDLLNQSAQTGAVIASVTSVTKLAGPYVPIISMPANIVAGTITFLKIGMDLKKGRELKQGDVLSLVGNVAGVIGTVAVLVGAGSGFIGFLTVASIFTGLYAIGATETFKKIVSAAGDFFRSNTSEDYLDYMCAPDMRIVDRKTLRLEYANMMLACYWISDTDQLTPYSMEAPDIGKGTGTGTGTGGGGGGGGGGLIGGTYSPSGPIIPSPAPPPHDVANVGISIIVAGKTYDAGDQYGCCTGTSDGYM